MTLQPLLFFALSGCLLLAACKDEDIEANIVTEIGAGTDTKTGTDTKFANTTSNP